MNSQSVHKTCRDSDQKISGLRKGSEQVPPLIKKLIAADTCWRREYVFSSGESLGISSPCTGVAGPHKTDLMVFWVGG